MSAIINIGSIQPAPSPIQGTVPATLAPRLEASQSGSDTVEFSTVGQALSRAAELSSLSVARIRAIRTAIDNGTYETPDRINETAARIFDRIR